MENFFVKASWTRPYLSGGGGGGNNIHEREMVVKKIRYQPLEPRILLDAAAAVTFAESTSDADHQNDLQNQIALSLERKAEARKVADPRPEIRNHQSDQPESETPAAILPTDLEATALVVVDTGVTGYEDLLTGLQPGTEILLIDAAENGLQKLADYVDGRDDITSIHILSHGDQGEFSLGTVTLNADNIDQHAELLAQIGASLTEQGDLLLYGCRVAAEGAAEGAADGEGNGNEPSGAEFVARIAEITGADVAASTDLTGAAAQDGDWDLEYSIGQMDGARLELTGFNGLLAPPTLTPDLGATDEDTPITVANDAPGTTTTDTDGATTTVNADLLLNDTDPDGDTLNITRISGNTIVTAGSTTGGSNGGEFTIHADGSWGFDPGTAFNDLKTGEMRTTSVLYSASDGGPGVTTTLTVTVSGINDAPVAGDDTGSTAENTVLRVAANAAGDNGANAGLLLNDTDPDGDLIITRVAGNTIVTAGSTTVGTGGGQFTVDADGAWRFDPGTAFDDLTTGETRATSVTYTITDGSLTDTATLTVTVNGANDAPTATDDAGATTENTELTVADDAPGTTITNDDSSTTTTNADLLLNDSDPESDTLTISRVAGSADNVGKATDGSNGGSFTISVNGAWSFTPDSTFDDLATGETRITSVAYTAFDGSLTDTATLTVTVTGGNDAPTAVNDTGATAENTELTVADGATGTNADLLLNDSDPDGDTLTISEVGGESANVGKATDGSNGGSFTISVNGAWSFNPGTSFDDLAIGATRATSVEYTATDGSQTDTATLTVTVSGANDGLTANADTGRTGKNRVLSVANDAAGGGNGLNADLLLNDVDIDGDSLTISAVGSTAQNLSAANLGGAITGNGGGRFTVRADGSWRFDPGTDFDNLAADTTRTASVVYRATDSNGETATATLTVTVYANFDPTAVDDAGSTAENTVLTVANDATGTNADLLLNDIDIDGDTLTISQVNGDADNVGKATRGTGGGQFTLYANGSWSFDPGTSFDDLAVGKTRTTSVDYTASDGSDTDTATLTVTVSGVNDGLTANADTGRTGENALLTVAVSDTGTTNANLLLNDVDIDGDTLTISQVGATADSLAAANVGTAIDGGNGGTFTLHADGSWEFNPGTSFDDLALGATRTTSVVYTASDGNGATAMATLTVTVSGAHDGLTPTADAGATTENTVVTVAANAAGTNGVNAGLLRNDNELDGDGLTITRIIGGVIANPGSPAVARGGGTFTIHADGAWSFDPGTSFDDLTTGESRTTSVEYRVSDGDGGRGAATLTVTVSGVNDAPTVVDDRGTTAENTALRVAADAVGVAGANAGLLLNDSDIDSDDLSISQVTGAANRVGMATAGSGGGLFTINTDGSWRFEPGTAFDDLADGKTRTTSVAYTVSDEDGGSTAATLTVTVTGTNDGLTANDDAGTTTENTQLTVADDATGTTDADSATINADLLLNDVDIDGDDLTITEVGGESSSVGKATDGSDGGSFTIDSKGGWTFDPDGDFDNLAPGVAKTTSVVYTASDGSLTDTATLTVTVTGINDAPTALDDAGATTENTSLTVAANAAGVDGVNAGLLRNDSDPNGDDLMISRVFGRIGSQDESGNPGSPREGGNGGSFTINADGSWSFDPGTDFDNLAAGKTRTTTVSYTLSDGNGGRDTATLTVTVTGENDGLTANDDTGATAENTKLTIADDATGTIVTNDDSSTTTTNADLLRNDVDIDTADILTISEVGGKAANVGTATTGSNGGSFTIESNGSWEFNPGTDFDDLAADVTKTTSVVYTATDGSFTDTATLTVTVTGENDAPVLTADTGTVTEDTSLVSGNLVASGTVGISGGDAGEDKYMTAPVTGAYGSLTITADGVWTYKALNSQSDIQDLSPTTTLTDTLMVTSVDGVTITTVTITINGDDDEPTLKDAVGSVTEDVSVVAGNLVASGTVGASGGDAGEDKFLTDPVSGDYGSLTITADGAWTYTALNSQSTIQNLAAGATLTDTLTVTSADTVTTTAVTITIYGKNDAPVAKNDVGGTDEDTALTVPTAEGLLANDSDRDGDTPYVFGVFQQGDYRLRQEATSLPQGHPDRVVFKDAEGTGGGLFTVKRGGGWSFDPGTDFQDLKVDEERTTSLRYLLLDIGALRSEATLTVTVTGLNDGLMAVDDVGTTLPGTELTVPDGAPGTTSGTTTINADLLGNDVDVDGDTLSISAVGSDESKQNQQEDKVGEAIDGSNGGKFTIHANGSWSFDPNDDFDDLAVGNTRTTSVVYTATDGSFTDTATLTVTVRNANTAPTATDDAGSTFRGRVLMVADDQPAVDGRNADLLLNDSDPDGDRLGITAVGSNAQNLSTAGVGKATAGANGGSFTIRADGSYTFDPDDDFNDLAPDETRTTSVVYQVSDNYGGAATATVTVTVMANNPPVAVDDLGGTVENTPLTVADGATGTTLYITDVTDPIIENADLLLNDSDAEGNPLTIIGISGFDADGAAENVAAGTATRGSNGGSFTIRANGSWEFNPGTAFDNLAANKTATTSVVYTVSDDRATDTASLTVTVFGANDAPTANDDTGATTENAVLTVAGGAQRGADLLLNDTDAESDPLTITEVGGESANVGKATDGSSGGSFTISASGAWEFNPGTAFDDLAAGATRITSVDYTASDGRATDTATLTVTVTGTNDDPVLTADTGMVTEDTSVDTDGNLVASGTVGASGGDAGEDQFMTTPVTGAYGTLTITADGTWTYKALNKQADIQDLNPTATLIDTLMVTSTDMVTTTMVTITIRGDDDMPTLTGDTGMVTEDTSVVSGNLVASGTVGATGGDDGEDQFMTAPVTGAYGSLTIAANGAWTYTALNSDSKIQGLGAGETLTDTLMVTSADTVTTTAVTITINGAADTPVANDDSGTTTENTPRIVADGATGTRVGGGAQRVNADLLLNDVDIDGDDLTITEVDGDTGSVGKATDGSDGGSFTIDSKGGWTFDPDSDFDDLAAGVTRTTSVVYTASDGTLTDTATLTVTVTGTNDGLTANDDVGTTTENKMLTVADGATGTTSGTTTTNADLLLNDVDIDGDDLTITEVDGDTGSVGKATDGSDGGSFTIRANGSWEFNPGTDFDDLKAGVTRTTSVEYTASDGTLTDTATLTVTVTGTNDGLTANDDAGTTTENKMLTVADGATGTTSGTTTGPGGGAQRVNADLLLNDVDIDGDDLTITEVDGDTGSVGKATDGSDGGSFTIDSKGGWTFDPNSDFDDLAAGVTRTTSVVYTASDGTLTDTATLTVTVTGSNDGLTANDDAGTTTENKMLTVADGATGTTSGTTPGPGGGAQRVNADLLLNDVDIDGDDLTITEVDGDTGSVGKATDGSDGGSFTIDSKGGWTFDPNSDFDDLAAGVTRTTSVVYTASDGTLTDTATLTVTVTGTNDGLTANDDAGTTTENKMLTVADGATGTTSGTTTTNADLLLNDVDIDGDDLTITEVGGDTGSVGKATDGSDGGSFTIDSKGGWTFDPNSDFDDLAAGVTRTTSVVYTASDGTLTDTATLTVTVTGTNDGLTANDDAGTTTENKMLTVADGATGTTSGTTPGPGGGAQRANADLLLNDVDIDGDDLTITEVDGDTGSVGKATDGSDGGSFTIDSKGGWTFDPDGDFDDLAAGVTRTTSVVYTASDGTLTDTATLTVTVTGTNDGLTANDDAGTTTENKMLTVADGATGTTSGTTNADLLLNDVDIDGDDLTITEVDGDTGSVGKATDGSDGGSFTIDSKGGWTFDPNSDFDDLAAGVTRTTSVVYTASDGTLTDTATLTVTVTGTNDGLTANDDAGTTTENKMLTVADGATGTTSGTTTINADLLLNDVDIDGDDLTITEVDGDTSSVGKATDGSDGGSFTIDSKGGWTFDPNSDFDDLAAGVTRTTSVVYTASDGTLTDTATLTVTVTGTNDGLTANDDAGTTTENTDLTVADGATGTTSGTTPGPGGGAQRVNADLLLNDVDIDGDDLTITEVDGDTGSVGKATDGSDGGSFTIDSKGGWTFDPNSDFDDLAAGVTRTTSVVYTASDGTLTDTATLTVTVTGTNDGLTANDDAGTTTENKMLTVADGATGTTSGTTPGPGGGAQRVNADLLLNDVDIDGDDLTITEVDGDTGSVGKATDGSDGGSFTIDSKGGWTFDPNSDFDDLAAGVTRTTSVVYTASDGTLTDTATLTVTVTGTNDGLTANDDAGTTTENKMLTVADGATGTTSGTTPGPGGGAQRVNADLLLNDVDIDGDDLTITEVDGDTGSVGKATDGSDGGSFTIDSKGGWTFDPNSDFDDLAAGVTRTTSVVYTASDGTLTDTATLTVTVTGTNDGLTANDDAGTTTENKMLTVADGATGTTSGTTPGPGGGAQRVNADLLLNDVDIDGDDLTITEVDGDTGSVGKATNGSDGGSFTIDSKGGWTFDPNSDFDDLAAGVTRTTSVVYTASDGTLTDTATLTVTVTGTNDGLTANDDAGTTTENTDLTVADGATGTTSGTTTINADLLLNDVDIDGDDLTITEVDGDTGSVGKATSGSDGGSFTIRANGSWEFNPGTDFDDLKAGVTRTTSVLYTASDGTLTDTATLTVTVTGTNDGLTANDDAGTTTENKMLTVADGATGTTSGTTTINADLLLNDVDIDSDDLTITEVDGDTGSVGKATDGSDGGSFTIDSKGGWTFDPNSDFDDLAAGVTRTTSVVYTASDGTLTDTATLTVTVTGTNDGLTANDDAGTTTENKMLTVADGATGTTSGTTTGPGGGAQRVNADLLLNDVDIDGDDLTITEVDGDTGSVGKATDGSDGGSFTIDSKGGWTFDPNSDFDDLAAGVTRTTSVVYTASDGTLTDTATLTVTVTGTNDGLTANDDAGTTTENKMLTVADGATGTTSGTTTGPGGGAQRVNADLLLNDVDIDGDDLTITEVDGDTGSVGKATDGSDGGSFTIDSKGGWTFDPNSDFDDLAAGVTRTTSVVYTASDGTLTDTATLTVTVTGTNDGLTANDDAGTTTENTQLTVANDATGITSGTTTGPGGGAQRVNADLLLNDVDIDSDDLTITEVDGDTASVGKATDGSDGGSFTIRANGSWEFNPGTDFDDLKAGVTRTTSVVYTASDGSLTDTATLTVTVTGTNDGLTANDDAGTTTENKMLTVADGATGTTSSTTTINADLLLNDVDIDGDDLTITEVDGDTGSVGKATDGSDGGSFTIDSKGGWTFDPNSDFDDLKAGVTRTTSVEYTASDGTLTDTATLTVTVTGTNDGLTANDDVGTTTENTELTVADGATGTTSGTTTTNADLLLNDVDIDGDDLTITEVDGDTGSVGKATDGSDGGSFTIDSKGGWTFDPNSDFDDLKAGVTRTTSVEYTASDGTLTDTATLTVTVTGANDGLTANDDAGTTTENKMLTVADGATGTTSGTTTGPGGGAQRVNADLLLNDVDIDGDDLTITEVDGDTGSVGKATDGSDGGSFTIDSKGGWTFDPNSDFDDLKAGVTRTTSVEYTASDGTLTDTATLTVTVTGANDGLTANDDAGTTTENKMLTVADGATGTTSGTTNADLLLNDVDIDGDDLTITEVDGDTGSVGKATDGSDGGSFTIDSKGGWTFDPNSDFDDLAAGVTRTTSVEYTASDGTLTDTATLTVTVTGTNDGLTANDDAGTTTENTQLTVADGATGTTSGTTTINADLLLNDVDIDGDDLTITEVDGDTGSVGKATDGSDGGSFTIDSKGGWTFDPNSDFDDLAAGVTRTTSVVYTASDGTLTDTATLTVTVTGTNDGLTANDDAGTTTENKMLTVADGATGTTSGTTPGPGGGAQRANADLLLNDVDIDGDDLTITEVDGDTGSVGKATDGSDGGSFTIDSKGGWTFDPNSDFDDLAAGVTRTTSVVYTASDGTLTDTATLTVTVTGTNDGLTANDDAGTTTENKMLTVADGATGTTSGTTPGPGGGAQRVNADLLLNDVDIDGDDLTITEVDGDTGSVGKATDGSDGGSFTIDSKGGWTFDPNSDFDDLAAGVTRTTSVVYTASDGTLTDTATLTVTVTGTNDGLTANDDAGTTTENTELTVADGATGTTSGTTPGPGGGAQRVNADLLLNDVDIDSDDLTITEVDGDTSSVGKATDGSDGGSFTIDSKGGWTFDPNSDFDDLAAGVTRTTSVVYTASDGTLTDTATLTVTVTGTNDGLTANDDAGTTTENKMLTVADGATGTTSGTTTINADLLLNDVDIDGDDLTITEVDGDTGSVGKATDGSDGGSFTIDSKGGWAFDPNSDFDDLAAGVTRTTSVVYTASDGTLTDTATLTVTVTGTNDGLTANDDAGTTTENKMLTVADGATGTTSGTTTTNADLLLNDVDIDGDDLTITEVDGDTGSVGKATDGSDGGSFTIDSKGGWTFDPNSDFDDLAAGVTRTTSVVYTASDGTLTDTATLTVTVTGTNDGLTANDDAGTTTENTELTVADGATGTTSGTTTGPGGGAQRVNADLLLNDVDIDGDDLTITEVDGDTGSVGKATDGSDGGSFTIDSKGGWTSVD